MHAQRTLRRPGHAMIAGIMLVALQAVRPAGAQVIGRIATDGTAGPRQSFSGPQYQVPASAGRLVGSTLFHSFSDFSVGTSDTVTFSGPDSVTRVIARVTGGAPSQIDGTVCFSGMPSANLYLINPAGIIFGSHAQILVPQSFTATTADWVRLSDGTIVSSTGPLPPVLTSAPPAAFGFLSPNKSTIEVQGSSLSVQTGKSLALVSGGVHITQEAVLDATDGRVQLVAAGTGGEAAVDAEGGGAASLNAAPSSGALVIEAGSRIAADGTGLGRVDLMGQQINLEGRVTDYTDKDGSGAQINVFAVGDCTIDGGLLSTQSGTSSPAGAITVQSGGLLKITQGGQISANTTGLGNGGLITLTPHDLLIDGLGATTTGVIAQTTNSKQMNAGQGQGGNIAIRTHTMTLLNSAVVSTTTSGSGNAGDITIMADWLKIQSEAEILAQTGGSGAGGTINVCATTIDIGKTVDVFRRVTVPSGIFADTTTGSAGPGGQIVVACQNLDIQPLGVLSTASNGSGSGGGIQVTANSIVLDGGGLVAFTGLVTNSQTTAAVPGGDINITAANIEVLKGAGISAITFGPGSAGNIALNDVQKLTIDGGISNTGRGDGGNSNPITTGIFVRSSGTDSPGNAGDITVHAAHLLLKRGGSIDSAALGKANAGSISIVAGASIDLSNSRISVSAPEGSSGVISLSALDIIHLASSTITGKANAIDSGRIVIDPATVILNDGSVINGQIVNGDFRPQDVPVTIDGELLVSQNSKILTNTGVFRIDDQFATGLVRLASALVLPSELQESCFAMFVASHISTFTVTSLGGLPIAPAGNLPSINIISDTDTGQHDTAP